jgi:hypothetical protein
MAPDPATMSAKQTSWNPGGTKTESFRLAGMDGRRICAVHRFTIGAMKSESWDNGVVGIWEMFEGSK